MGEFHMNSWAESMGEFHTTTSGHVVVKHYKKSDFVLVKTLVPFHGQVNKALRSISYWLVSLLAPLFYTNHFPSIANRGKQACSSQIRALPLGQKCIVAAARERLSVCVSPDLHLVEWTRHNMDRSQIVAAYNTRQSGSQVELSRISVSLEFECFLENGCNKGNKILTIIFIETSIDFWALSYFAIFW